MCNCKNISKSVVVVVFVRTKELTIVEVFHFFINKGNEFKWKMFYFLVFNKMKDRV